MSRGPHGAARGGRAGTGPPLTWRVALLAGAATAVLAALTLVAAYVIVRAEMYADLRRSLRADALALADIYSGGEGSAGIAQPAPTGGVILQVYGPGGQLLAASRPEYEQAQAAIPPSDVMGAGLVATEWSGSLRGQQVEAVLAPFALGVVAVIADPTYISDTLTRLSRTLLPILLVLIVLSLLVGYLVAGASLRPITRLARRASLLGPDRLEPLEYEGPKDEVAELTETLNELLAGLSEARDAQRVFLAETSHELRTPLTSLRGFLDRAARTAGEAAAEDLHDAQRVSLTMTRLVEDLLQLSRGELVKDPQLHLIEIGSDVIYPVAAEFDGVQVDGGDPALVLGDPVKLRQLLRNLLANAVRAVGAPRRVAVSAEAADGVVDIRVEDDGPGIPPEQQERIFEKFFKGAGGGSGLGLAIARQIARHHHGDLTVESEPGRTVFHLHLPLLQEDDVE